MTKRLLCVLMLAFSLGLVSPDASAAMSREQAVRMVQQQTDGRILSVDTVRRGNRIIYRIKVLTPEGHVRVIEVDGGRVDSRGRR